MPGIQSDSRRWWEKSDGEAADGISATLGILMPRQRERVSQLADQARLYGNLTIWGMSGLSRQEVRVATKVPQGDRITHNVCQSCADTVTAKIAKNKPKPWFQTTRGDFAIQRKAKKLNDFETGIFYEQQGYALGLEAFRDATVWGDGFLYVGKKFDRIYTERTTPSELWVDEWEGMRRRPRQLHRVMLVDRSVAAAQWPGKRAAIMSANNAEAVAANYYPNVSDLIEVRESWHLRSGPEAKDGKHVITIPGGKGGPSACLIPMEEWPHDYFPFARMSWSPKPIGFWSQGLVEQLYGIQRGLNKLLRLCSRSHDLGGSFKLLLHNTSKIVTEHLRPEIGAEVHWGGSVKPEYILPPHVPPEVYQEIKDYIDRAYQIAGLSQTSAAGVEQENLTSGRALRTRNDIENDRFRTIGGYWENFFCGAASASNPFPPLGVLYVETAREIANENGGHYRIKVPGKKFLQEMDWKDIDLEADEYQLQCYPISAFSQEPGERMQDVQDLAQAGLIPQEEVPELLDFPDLAKFETIQGAQKEYIEMVLDKIVDGDGSEDCYTPPEPLDNLDMFARKAGQYYAEGKVKGLGEEQLSQLRRLMTQIDALKQRAMPPPMPVAPGAPGGPPQPGAPAAGRPALAPVSPLMPQVAAH
jgi:hypothetical protein